MKKLLGVLGAVAVLGACQADIQSNQYGTSSVGQANPAAQCRVINVRRVNVKSDNELGTLIGGAAGGVAGYAIGGDSTAHWLGSIGGAVLGGVAKQRTNYDNYARYRYIVKPRTEMLIVVR